MDAWERSPAARPTSSVFGSGAIAAAEAAFSKRHWDRPTLLLPSATYALRVGLQALGVGPGDEVLCGAVDWQAGLAAAVSLGARPVGVAMDPETLTLDPLAAAKARTSRTRAIIACHLHGVCADIPALRALLPGVAVVEDAAQAFGCTLDGHPAGSLGDVAVLSLGPGKQIDAGEGGVLICGDAAIYKSAAGLACHPLRHLVTGIPGADPSSLSLRPHPMTAVLALHALAEWSPEPARAAHAATREILAADRRVRIIGDGFRRSSTCIRVPVLLDSPDQEPPPGVWWSKSGARVLPCLLDDAYQAAAALLVRVKLAALATEAGQSRR